MTLKIGNLYAVWYSGLNTILANEGKDKIPVRLLSGTEWSLPKTRNTLQEHQAAPSARFALTPDQDVSIHHGRLVCWPVGDPWQIGDPGPHAATGPDAIQRLRALPAPDLKNFRDYLYGPLRDARMRLDVIPDDELTDLIPQET